MAPAIAAYIVFMLFWDALMFVASMSLGVRSYGELSEFVSRSLCLNPKISGAFFVEQSQASILGTRRLLEPIYATLSTIAWTAIPPVPACLRYRRVPLYPT